MGWKLLSSLELKINLLKITVGLGVIVDKNFASIAIGMEGVSVIEGVFVMVGVAVMEGVMVMVGVSVMVGVMVMVGDGGK